MRGRVIAWLGIFAAVAVCIGGCGMSATKKAAEKKADELFAVRATGDLDALLDLYAPVFYQHMPRDKWRATLELVTQQLGPVRSRQLANWRTTVNTAGADGTDTQLLYHVEYSKAKGTETLQFLGGDGDTPPLLIGHTIFSSSLKLPPEGTAKPSEPAPTEGAVKPDGK